MIPHFRKMSFGEILFRSRQSLFSIIDRFTVRGRYHLTESGHSFHNARIARLISRAGFDGHGIPLERFFLPFSEIHRTLDIFKRNFSDSADTAISRALMAEDGKFDILGRKNVDFGRPVRWNYDPLSGTEIPVKFWSDIDFLDHGVVGDHKVVWELNRHQHVTALGKAYILTGDERYLQTWVTQAGLWMDENPPKFGINWASSLEVALRSISWIWAILFFFRSDGISKEFRTRFLSFLFVNGLHIENNLSTYFSPNTHLTGEALGLFYLGLLFEKTDQGKRWLGKGREILLSQLDKQILPDGVYFEQASYYHRYTTDIYIHFYILLKRNRMRIPQKLTDSIQKLLDFLAFSQKPDGTTPLYGDDDGGRLMFLNEDSYADFRSCLSTGAVLFRRSDYRMLSGSFNEETLWLLGPESLEKYNSLESDIPDRSSLSFSAGGCYIMRSGWERDDGFMLIDCGAEETGTCGHSHSDMLNLHVAAAGRDLLIDPGTYTYTASTEMRDYFRGSQAHNTVSADGRSQARPDGPFSWSSRAFSRVTLWLPENEYDFFSGRAESYADTGNPLLHERNILFLKDHSSWIVLDRISSAKAREVTLAYHFASEEAELKDNRFLLSERGELYGSIAVFPGPGHLMSIRDDWRSPAYSIKNRAKTGICCFENTTDCSVISLISARPGSCKWVGEYMDPAFMTKREIDGKVTGETVTVNEKEKLIDVPGSIRTDFRWIWHRPAEDEDTESYTLIQGKRAFIEGMLNLTLDEPADMISIERRSRTISVMLPDKVIYSHELLDDSLTVTINGVKIRTDKNGF